jgi:formylglycine-generating enzyme required for sulfatase activity
MPIAIWQMLPEWMWQRTALGRGTYVAVRNSIPGAINSQLKAEVLGLDEPEDRENRLVVPVIVSEKENLKRWSRVLTGDRRSVTPGFLLPQGGGSVPTTQSVEDTASERLRRQHDSLQNSPMTGDSNSTSSDSREATATKSDFYLQSLTDEINKIAQERLQKFRLLSSPRARRLAMLLAASPVITLPVMRLIRASMQPEISPLPVAEVFLGGLLKKVPGQPENTDPEEIQYDFIAGVREELLQLLPESEVVEVINKISYYVAERLGYTSLREFRAFLTNPDVSEPEELKGLKSFASVTANILERLGGNYANFARELRQGAGEIPSSNQLPNIPPLRTFEYEFGEITEILERFEFETATVSRENEEWVIQRSRRATWGYTEPLNDEINLEMISIPGGTFLMGAPEDEPDSYDQERPQHEVTLKPFYLGRYAVTQAQWRIVANYPQIDRELNPDPSQFKGDNRPVENVSWEDAVEFCKRLSAKTRREYKLPSEAQWEYACRAGTETPFHFGEIITTELVNYDGTSTYNGSPEGEYREHTTDVGSFPANAWGLYDMHGNVFEWCLDDYHSYEGAPTDGSAWIDEDRTESTGVGLRGGSWLSHPGYCRSAYRYINNRRDIIINYAGFRVLCIPGLNEVRSLKSEVRSRY